MLSNIQRFDIPPPPTEPISHDVFVVSEDEPGQWRVADRANDVVFGPLDNEAAALRVAFEGVRFSRRWEIHVLDRFGVLTSTYNSDEDAMHVKVDIGE